MKLPRTWPFLFLFVAWGALEAWGQNVSFRDYVVPTSEAESLFVNLALDYDRLAETTRASDGSLDLAYRRFYDSLPFAYSVYVVGSWSRLLTAQGNYALSYRLNSEARVKKYLWNHRRFFLSLSALERYQRGDDRPGVSTTLGVGYGRFLTATSLRKAVRVETFLLKEGIISQRLPKENILNIAHIIRREREYREQYGSPAYRSYWYEDIEEEIRKSGVLTGEGLGAAGVLRIEEVLFRENIGERFVGYDLTLGLQQELLAASPGQPRTPSAVELAFRYARPIAWTTQVELEASGSAGIRRRPGERRTAQSRLSSGFLYELTNRIDFRVDYEFLWSREATGEVRTSHTLLPSFLFYLENEVRLLASLRLIKPRGEAWVQEFSLTLNYKAL
ncbi:MAG: hypothetical protein KatS3mg115_2315 [Candidatus Poribacteria bacterium]|nr:MAG: hypothetical protein KatS3mg115_2315 [Candidatus Poribacteria bacterium]